MCIRDSLKGVVYLKAAARIGLEDREELEGVTKRLYPAIAKECRTCAGRVEHAIRHAIHTSWEKGDVRQQRMVFGYDRESGNLSLIHICFLSTRFYRIFPTSDFFCWRIWCVRL